MGASRFAKEGALEPYMDWVKGATTKPVVTVGRFTSPDAMADQIRRGVIDCIGAARPSIADPFLPRKIAEGRAEDIRECVGCNLCYAHKSHGVPIRCTRNPTMGEEWRPGWHPERMRPASRARRVLVVGAGPAGLEAARVSRESRLPGLAEWARVRDWRIGQIGKLPGVEVFRGRRRRLARRRARRCGARGAGADLGR